jgi:hypothetical protein
MDTSFKFLAEGIGFELEGSEEFVRSTLSAFLPYVKAAGGDASPATGTERQDRKQSELARWYHEVVPAGESPTMQDHILVFAYYLNRVRKQFIFVPDDMKAAFAQIGHEIPKSLLQILGSLKRDRGLLYSGDKRGEYSITPAGLRHVEAILGLETVAPETTPENGVPLEPEPALPEDDEEPGGAVEKLFRNLRGGEGETDED